MKFFKTTVVVLLLAKTREFYSGDGLYFGLVTPTEVSGVTATYDGQTVVLAPSN